MTYPEGHADPAADAGAKVTQALAVAATGAEALAQLHARRAQERADTSDRQARALRVEAKAREAAGLLGGQLVPESERPARFDATGEPMPSPTAVPVVDGEVVAQGHAGTQAGQPGSSWARAAASAGAEQARAGAETAAAVRAAGVRS